MSSKHLLKALLKAVKKSEEKSKTEMEMNLFRPSFYKIMFGNQNSEKMRIPPSFVKHLSKDLSDTATIEVPSGDRWTVAVNASSSGIYFQDGWQKFVRETSVVSNEFLLFRYDGEMCFSVEIFETSGYKRLVPRTEETKSPPAAVEKKKRGRPRKHVVTLQPYEGCSAGFQIFQEVKDAKKTREEASSQPAYRFQCMHIQEENGDHLDTPTEVSQTKSRDACSRKEECMASKKAMSFTSEYPCFKVAINEDHLRRRDLHLGVPFSRKYMPRAKTKIMLVVPNGENQQVNFIITGKRPCLSGGWTAFHRNNQIRVGNVCIFEIIDTTTVRVHIFHDN